MNSILSGIIGGVIAIIIAFIAHILGPRLSEKFKLRVKLAESYLAPYKEWCSNFYGELKEFNIRYLEKDYSNISALQIITDYRELHETLRFTSRWIGKIEKNKKRQKEKTVGDRILKLLEIIDPFWHSLENSYSRELPSTGDIRFFEKCIKNLSKRKRNKIAQAISDHLSDKKQTYLDVKISTILNYLEKKIP